MLPGLASDIRQAERRLQAASMEHRKEHSPRTSTPPPVARLQHPASAYKPGIVVPVEHLSCRHEVSDVGALAEGFGSLSAYRGTE